MDERRQVKETMALVVKANRGVLLAMGALFVVSARLTKTINQLNKELRQNAVQVSISKEEAFKQTEEALEQMVEEYSERVN